MWLHVDVFNAPFALAEQELQLPTTMALVLPVLRVSPAPRAVPLEAVPPVPRVCRALPAEIVLHARLASVPILVMRGYLNNHICGLSTEYCSTDACNICLCLGI